jgi:hypothetical protein
MDALLCLSPPPPPLQADRDLGSLQDIFSKLSHSDNTALAHAAMNADEQLFKVLALLQIEDKLQKEEEEQQKQKQRQKKQVPAAH